MAKSLNILAVVLWYRGDLTNAEKHYRDALAMERELLGEKHVQVAASLNLGLVLQPPWRLGRS